MSPQFEFLTRIRARRWIVGGMASVLVLLGGCAQQRIRDEAQLQLREGRYEKAVEGLADGLKRYPDSALLRSGLIQTRNEVLTRLLAEAGDAGLVGLVGHGLQGADHDHLVPVDPDLDGLEPAPGEVLGDPLLDGVSLGHGRRRLPGCAGREVGYIICVSQAQVFIRR